MRLIDADAYKGKAICNHTYSGVKKLINIDDIPTAYDVDKVVEELEDFLINYGIPQKSNVHQKIMGIVNQGGVSDDVCEWEHKQVKEHLEELKRYRGLEGQGFPSKAFEKLLHNIAELREVVTCDEDAEWNRALFECTKIVHSISEDYADGWIPCTLIDHPDDVYDCEVTTLQNGEYIRDIGFYTDKWRRLSDETPILVVAWKEPSTPYQPK